ncbi:uncharacterized protein LOC106172464 [Lingula anatina]|uniref:Uncharacterized protein LOC106172464 n=1 Tax=Lingula anatina TaxID=7574 RepID=A0A1S3JE06_LINAN|nr:uncharacterized protein LOC106172464 [Lingula anatina]|eukprot:XP_013408650.1 uncharacterized protein LOC106172464 [Lingula anatina]
MLSACQQILAVSATVNLCCLTFFLSRRCLRALGDSFLGEKAGFLRRLSILDEDNGAPISRLISFHSMSWALLIFGIYLATATPVMRHPFVTLNTLLGGNADTNPKVTPTTSYYEDLINVAFAINIGKYVYKLCQDCILVDHVLFKLDSIHHVVTIACYSIFLLFRENMVLGITGLLMEGSPLFVDCAKIMKQGNLEKDSKNAYISLLIASLVMTSMLRLVVPAILLIVSAVTASPFTMHYASLSAFFLSITFFTVLSLWTLKAGAVSLRKAVIVRKMRTFEKALQPVIKNKAPLEEREVIELTNRSSISVVKNDFQYSRAYSNINVNCLDTNDVPQRNLSANKQVNKVNVKLLLQYSRDHQTGLDLQDTAIHLPSASGQENTPAETGVF